MKTKLLVDNMQVNVLMFDYNFKQPTSNNNKPNGIPKFNGLVIKLEKQPNLNLTNCAIEHWHGKQLELHIYPSVLNGRIRKLFFYDCHLIKWDNIFLAEGNNPATETLHLTCAGVREGDVEFSTSWRETFDIGTPIKEEEEKETQEKKLVNYSLSYSNNKPVEEYMTGETIILTIETENRIGDKMKLSLNNNEYNFEYNGKLLENDILDNLTVTNNIMKIPLKVLKQKV